MLIDTSHQTDTAPRTNSDLLAEHKAREAALTGEWEKFARPGYAEAAKEIAVVAVHPEAELIPVTVVAKEQ